MNNAKNKPGPVRLDAEQLKLVGEVRAKHPEYTDEQVLDTVLWDTLELSQAPAGPDPIFADLDPPTEPPVPGPLTVEEAIRAINHRLSKGLFEVIKSETQEEKAKYGDYHIEEMNFDPPIDEETPRQITIVIRRNVDVESVAHRLGVLAPEGKVIFPDGEGR